MTSVRWHSSSRHCTSLCFLSNIYGQISNSVYQWEFLLVAAMPLYLAIKCSEFTVNVFGKLSGVIAEFLLLSLSFFNVSVLSSLNNKIVFFSLWFTRLYRLKARVLHNGLFTPHGNRTETRTGNCTTTIENNGSWFLSLSWTSSNISVQYIWTHCSWSHFFYLSQSHSRAVWMSH